MCVLLVLTQDSITQTWDRLVTWKTRSATTQEKHLVSLMETLLNLVSLSCFQSSADGILPASVIYSNFSQTPEWGSQPVNMFQISDARTHKLWVCDIKTSCFNRWLILDVTVETLGGWVQLNQPNIAMIFEPERASHWGSSRRVLKRLFLLQITWWVSSDVSLPG